MKPATVHPRHGSCWPWSRRIAAIATGALTLGMLGSISPSVGAATSGSQAQAAEGSARSITVKPQLAGTATSNGGWTGLGGGVVDRLGDPGRVNALAISDDTVFVGGYFETAGGVASVDLTSWSLSDDTFLAMTAPISRFQSVLALTWDSSRSRLYFGGDFKQGDTGGLADFNAVGSWSPTNGYAPLGQGVCASFECPVTAPTQSSYPGNRQTVRALAVGTDDSAYVGGMFRNGYNGGWLRSVGLWNDDTFVSMAQGLARPTGTTVITPTSESPFGAQALAVSRVSDDTVYVGGTFYTAQGTNNSVELDSSPTLNGIAAWSNIDDTYYPIGQGLTFDGAGQGVRALAVAPQDDTVYLGGQFVSASGVADTRSLAAWSNRDKSYHSLGLTLASGDYINALSLDDTHRLLYAAGKISGFGNLAVLDLRTGDWAPFDDVSPGVSQDVNALALDDTLVYVGGSGFTKAGSKGLARWTWAAPYGASGTNSPDVEAGIGVETARIGGQGFIAVTAAELKQGGQTVQGLGVDYANSADDSLALTIDRTGLAAGEYDVVVSAIGGTSTVGTITVYTAPTAAPSAPRSVSATQTPNGNPPPRILEVSWTKPATGAPILEYRATATDGAGNVTSCTTTSATSCSIGSLGSPLASDGYYDVTVEARNAIGWGPASLEVKGAIASAIPAKPVLNPSDYQAGDTKITVTWAGPASGQPAASMVVAAGTSQANFGTVCTTSSGPPFTCTFSTLANGSPLVNGTAYTVSVVAKNAIFGQSPPADRALVTPTSAPGPGPGPDPNPGPSPVLPAKPDAPASVSVAASSKSATITWSAAPAPSDGPVVLYRATASPGGASCSTDGSATSCTIEGLTDGRSYMVSVAALNAGGFGPSATAGPVIPASVAPGTPGKPRVVAGNGQLMVTITPGSGGGVADTYVATASPGGASCTVAVPATSCAIPGLTNGTDYSVSVVAKNAAGESVASTPSSMVSPDGTLPEPPATPGTAVVTPDDRSAKVTVIPGAGGGAPDTYTVTASPGTGTCKVTAPATSCVVTGLTNGTAYTFTVTAANRGGVSSVSVPSAPVVPAVPAPVPPATVDVLAGDGAATVAVTPGTGGGAVSFYRVTATPGGAWCSITPPAGACQVEGLDNGTAYTFTATAYNNSGASPASPATEPVTPAVPITPVIAPLPAPLSPGDSRVTEGGEVAPGTTVEPDAQGLGLDVQGPGFAMNLTGIDSQGYVIGLAGETMLLLEDGRARSTGEGFRPGSRVDLYVDPPVRVAGTSSRATEGIFLGTFPVDYLGTFAATAKLPASVSAGDHVLQAVGVTGVNTERAVSIGIRVLGSDMTLTLNKGKRGKVKGGDRIATTGTTSGIPSGAKLVPFIRYGKAGAFTRGIASIVVQDNGTFRWTRKIARGKDFTAFVGFTNKKSNSVTWVRIR